MTRTILSVLLFAILATGVHGATRHQFEPLNDELLRNGVLKVPSASDYPGASAVAVLSLNEYRQYSGMHQKLVHQVIKILTAEGKDYATISLPCNYDCSIDARTIKPDGKIIPVPGKDVVRSTSVNRTGYRSPYSLVQFSVPGVEPGDLVEYVATFSYPYPFFMDDFRFSEPYPIHKGIFSITHQANRSYSYRLYTPEGTPQIKVQPESFVEAGVTWYRTRFVIEGVAAWNHELHSARLPEGAPGVRLLLSANARSRFVAFENWDNYAGFITSLALTMPTRATTAFTAKAVKEEKDPGKIVALVYRAADREIRLSDESLAETGFYIEKPENVLNLRFAAPHDFAVFLAACFQEFGWGSDLILVNSHEMPEVTKDFVFPAYLNMAFLKVRTPSGDYFLDCNGNGMPVGALSSVALNRFSLSIPLVRGKTDQGVPKALITSLPFSKRNRTHVDFVLEREGDHWKSKFTWSLEGEFQVPWTLRFNRVQASDFRKSVVEEVDSTILLQNLKDIDFQFTGTSFVITGSGTLPRRMWSEQLEAIRNDFWDPGFSYRKFILEARKGSLVLDSAGEFSSTITIPLAANLRAAVPEPATIECNPAKYSVAFAKQQNSLQVKEELIVRDLLVRPSMFESFGKFLDAYLQRRSWSVLLAPDLPDRQPPAAVNTVLAAFPTQSAPPKEPAPAAAKTPVAARAATPLERKEGTCEGNAVIKVTGENATRRISLTVANYTPDSIDQCEFDLYYLNGNADEVHESRQPKEFEFPILSLKTKQFVFTTDTAYDIAKIFLRVQQNGKWIQCGPYWIQKDKKNAQ